MQRVAIVLLLAAAPAMAQDALGPVRDLYANADYDGALGALDRLDASSPAVNAVEVNRYRALCLFALGRTADAEVVIERILRADPGFSPGDEAAPRVRTAFQTVRLRVLPQLVRAAYTDAKAAYDRKDFSQAVPAFEQTLDLLESLPQDDPALGDLRTLATGFLDLSRAAAAPAKAELPAAPPAPEPPPPPAASVEPAVEPAIIQQTLPPWNTAILGAQAQMEFRGAVEVTIDEQGAVAAARIVDSVHPSYDEALLAAARLWRYRPATRGGKAVPSTKRVDVVLRPR